MERIGVEQVSQPLTYKSVFSISNQALSDLGTTPLKSPPSGMGWSFRLVKLDAPVGGRPRARVRNGVKADADATVSGAALYLDVGAWLISFAVGHLTVDRVACEVTTPLGDRSFDKQSIPLSPQTILASFDYPDISSDAKSSEGALTVTITVEIGQCTGTPAKALDARVLSAVEDSFTSGSVGDTKIYVYSRRGKGMGSACAPKTFFVSSSVLHKFGCEDLELHLAGQGFKDSSDAAIDLHRLPSSDLQTDSYDYDSDSDLEDNDPTLTSSEPMSKKTTDQTSLGEEVMSLQGESDIVFLRTGRIVFLRATAARTWEAFQRYVYFNEIEFAKLKSSYPNASEASARFKNKTCSPKSMYRFADQFGLDTLKTMALTNLKAQFNAATIVGEVLSTFSSRYPEIRDAEAEFLLQNYSNDKVQSDIIEGFEQFVSAEDHVAFLLKTVLRSLRTTPSTVGCPVSNHCSYSQRCGCCGQYHTYHHN